MSERQRIILDFFAENPALFANAMSEKMSEKVKMTDRTIEGDLA